MLVRDDSLTALFLWRARTLDDDDPSVWGYQSQECAKQGVRTSRVPVESVTGSLRLANAADITTAIGIKTPSLLHAVATRSRSLV